MAAPPKQKMTFRIDPELARTLREVPNQTAFVEEALREALGHICPTCHGTGRTATPHLLVSDLKGLRGRGRIDRQVASQLRSLVRVGRALLATQLEIAPDDGDGAELGFRLAREDEILLTGRLRRGEAELIQTH